MDFCEFIMMLIKNLKNYESKNITQMLCLCKRFEPFEMFKLWNVLRTCLEVVKLKGFHVFVYAVEAEQCCIVLRKFSRMSVKRILAKQILPSISRVSIIKELSPLIYASANACFQLHRLKKLVPRKWEGYFKASVITEAINKTGGRKLKIIVKKQSLT